MTHQTEQHAEFDLLMESQFWPANRIRELQRDRLERLLRHARAHAPYYATRLNIVFAADGKIDWERWEEIPPLPREDLLKHRRAMLARAVPPGHEQIGEISTSGSTGRPATTSHSKLALELTKAAVFRANVNDKVDFGTRLGAWVGEKVNDAVWPDGRLGGSWGPWWDERAKAGESFTLSHTSPPAQTLEYFARHQVRYALMGGTDARLLAYEAQRLGLRLALDGIFTRGTDPTPMGTQLVADVFGGKTFPIYSSKEGHRMAHRCPDCGEWHVNDEQVLVEIVDRNNRSVAAGESGRIVITPLWGYAQPLIRYEQGDYATRGASGACNRGLSTINQIVGRIRHMFIMPDGSSIVPTLTPHAVQSLNASMFQVAQVSLHEVVVRYVPLPNDITPDLSSAETELAAQLHPGIKLSFRATTSFEVPPGRKHLEFVSEINSGS